MKLEAASELFTRLPPVERAAVLLKDVFDLSIEETASALESTVGAVKAALHRGRVKLNQPSKESAAPEPKPQNLSPALVERFIEAFNSRDINRLTALIREDTSSEMVGLFIEQGAEAIAKSGKGVLHHTFASTENWRGEVRVFAGEPIGLLWARDGTREAVASMVSIEEREGAISVRSISLSRTPTEVGADLGMPVRTNGYRPTW